MFKILITISFILLSATLGLAQNKSVYTSLTEKNCKVTYDKQIHGNMSADCAGVGGYGLKVYADDDRMSVSVVAPGSKVSDLDFWGYFHNFSTVGQTAEWRMKGRKPVALIIRYDITTGDNGEKRTSFLMVSKIAAENPCVVAVVKPGRNQNAEARRLADAAIGKPCKKTE